MPRKGSAPTQKEFAALAEGLRPGQRHALGAEIYLTVDGAGRLRFQWRARLAGRGSRYESDTCDTYAEAVADRQKFLASKTDGSARRREKRRKMALEDYVDEKWWPDVLEVTEPTTYIGYERVWATDIKPFWKGWTLGDIASLEDLALYDQWLRKRKVHRHGKRKGQPAHAAVDKAYDILGRIFGARRR